MAFLFTLIYWETIALLFCAVGVVAVLILSGEISLDRLLLGTKANGDTYYSPERTQLLLVTIAVAFQFLAAVLRDPIRFPDVSTTSLALLGGSHFVYLGGKTVAAFMGNTKV